MASWNLNKTHAIVGTFAALLTMFVIGIGALIWILEPHNEVKALRKDFDSFKQQYEKAEAANKLEMIQVRAAAASDHDAIVETRNDVRWIRDALEKTLKP